MRKLLMMVTMLLVPALASAWTLPVKVTNNSAGITAGNKATVTFTGAPAANVVTSGTKYFYPGSAVASATITLGNPANILSVKVNGAVPAGFVAGTTGSVTVTKGAASLYNVEVVYKTASTTAKRNITVTQTAGGLTSISIGSSVSTVGFTGVPEGTLVKVKNQASAGYAAGAVTVTGATLAGDSFVVGASDVAVSAAYTAAPTASVSLSAPALATTGQAVTATANVVTTGTPTYAFSVTGCTTTAASASGKTYTFTPTSTGTCTVSVDVSLDGGATVAANTTASISVTSATASQNYSCTSCHSGSTPEVIADYNSGTHGMSALPANTACTDCHKSTTGAHSGGCIGCHSVAQNIAGNADNDGVRAITGEFGKWSHHVTGVTLNNAHCAACHLEGKVVDNAIHVDTAYHLTDGKTHLRDTTNNTDADFAWDPTAPNHTGMDQYCLSCHDANGAVSPGSAAIQAYINSNSLAAAGKTASPTNPFGDTISNQYDMIERPAVVDAKGQFATGNNSHHAVLGKKYTGRTRAAGPRQIANAAAFASNSSATLPGKRSTIFDAGKFQDDYITLADAAGETDEEGTLNGRNGGTTLGDDSTLHCGDCHTVGQFRNENTRYNKAVIGAHGSNNEYMLRNNAGTDARHQGAETVIEGGNADNGTYGTKPYLVCFNCHAFRTYGTITSNNGETGVNHAGEYNKDARCNGPYNTVFTNYTGETRLRSIGTATGAANYGKLSGNGQFYGNMFGIQCANCHNSGVKGNLFGGIHGSKEQTYVDGMGNTTKHFRFMPGLGNSAFVPGVKGGFTGGTAAVYKAYSGNRNGTGAGKSLGQTWTLLPVRTIKYTKAGENSNGSYEYITGGVSNDLNWEQRVQQPIAGQMDLQSRAMGCYTITPDPGNYTWEVLDLQTPADKVVQGSAPAGQQKNPKVLALQAAGYPADDIRNSATTHQTAGDGREMFDVWGGCDDHNGAPGAGTNFVRKVLRKVSY